MEFLFWFSFLLIVYTYAGYPLIIMILLLFVNKSVEIKDIEPQVTFLITAYNEEKGIAKKLENTLALDYPVEKLEIIVASDASTDRTDEIVQSFQQKGVKLVRVEGRVGKTETQNRAVHMARGEIIIFSDATTEYKVDAVKKIVRNYNDIQVGAVSGRYIYRKPSQSSMSEGTNLFWHYENFIKTCQTRIKTITGCCGCIYSVRKKDYVDLPPEIISDLVEPLMVLKKGKRIVFEPEAIAFELPTVKSDEEFSMRVRVISRGMTGILYVKQLINPFRYGFVSFQLISHKVLRWFLPVFLLLLFMSCLALYRDRFYFIMLIGQILFYLMAVAGLVAERFGIKHNIFMLPLYFVILNIASLVSLVKTFMGHKKITWETIRD